MRIVAPYPQAGCGAHHPAFALWWSMVSTDDSQTGGHMADDTTVAVLGTGIMGAAMARNILASGMEVRAWNRSPEKAEPLEEDGAEVADNPEGAARGADFLLTMLADTDAV